MPKSDTVLIDTHVLLWWRADGTRLSKRASAAIDDAETVLISPISAWEIGMLVHKGHVSIDRPLLHWIDALFQENGIDVADLSPTVAAHAATLDDFHGDPADRIIYSSALLRHCPLVTKDGRIRTYANDHKSVQAVW